MDQLTSDLQGVAVYIDDILVSGATASEHHQTLHCMESKGLRCQSEEVCRVRRGITKGPEVNDVMQMPAPGNVSGLPTFLGSFQF